MDKYLADLLGKLGKKLPKFPDGRINYGKSTIAPVVTLFVKYNGKILLMKRSTKVRTYKGRWCTVAGYIDETKPVKEKMLEELSEETGINRSQVKTIKVGRRFSFTDRRINRTFIVYPGFVELGKRPNIKIDWEHTDYIWIDKATLNGYSTVPHLDKSLRNSGL